MLSVCQGKELKTYVPDYVVFDFETTGISKTTDDIIEISAVRVRQGREESAFSALVNPHRPIPYQASLVNHITDEMVADEPGMDCILPQFLDFIGSDVLVGHNIASFDLSFLYRETQKFLGGFPDNDYVDTLHFARQRLTGISNYRLVTLAEHYGCCTQGAHRALNDCRMNQQVFELLSREEAVPIKTCPRCGGQLRQKNGRFGAFFGCAGYPACRYTENIK